MVEASPLSGFAEFCTTAGAADPCVGLDPGDGSAATDAVDDVAGFVGASGSAAGFGATSGTAAVDDSLGPVGGSVLTSVASDFAGCCAVCASSAVGTTASAGNSDPGSVVGTTAPVACGSFDSAAAGAASGIDRDSMSRSGGLASAASRSVPTAVNCGADTCSEDGCSNAAGVSLIGTGAAADEALAATSPAGAAVLPPAAAAARAAVASAGAGEGAWFGSVAPAFAEAGAVGHLLRYLADVEENTALCDVTLVLEVVLAELPNCLTVMGMVCVLKLARLLALLGTTPSPDMLSAGVETWRVLPRHFADAATPEVMLL